MNTLAPGVSFLDLNFLGQSRVIASAVLHGASGVAIIDPGPSSTLPVLRKELDQAGLSLRDVTTVLLTHIHLDHAGATGTIVAENPHIRVYVHENGAAHLVAPEKLIASATRLWGDEMDRLWGAIEPVASDAIVPLKGGETVEAAGRTFAVAYTPGHASHHVSYFNADTGIAFVGDTAGVKVRPGGYVLPATPPPDVDLEIWRESVARIAAWKPDTLFVTHFGPSGPQGAHLAEFGEHLEFVANLAKASLAREESDASREAWFSEEIRRELRRREGDDSVRTYEFAGRFDLNWRGLARYWRKKRDR